MTSVSVPASPSKSRGAPKRQKTTTPDEDDEGSSTDNDEADERMDIDVPDVPHSTKGASSSGGMVVGEGARHNRIIGNVHPLYDFKQNLARGDLVTKAVADLGEVISEIVDDSFSSQRFGEALECMKEMRRVAVEVSLSYVSHTAGTDGSWIATGGRSGGMELVPSQV